MIVFNHGDFDDNEIYCVQRWIKVEVEGPEEYIFEPADNAPADAPTPIEDGAAVADLEVEIPSSVFRAMNNPKGVSSARNQDLSVDCDNDAALKNVLLPASTETIGGQEWGWDGGCNRATTATQYHRVTIDGVHRMKLNVITAVEMFLIFLPVHIL